MYPFELITMKRIIIVMILIATTGILTSCSKQNKVVTIATFERSTSVNKKDIGTAD
jgi:hypothetical protein